MARPVRQTSIAPTRIVSSSEQQLGQLPGCLGGQRLQLPPLRLDPLAGGVLGEQAAGVRARAPAAAPARRRRLAAPRRRPGRRPAPLEVVDVAAHGAVEEVHLAVTPDDLDAVELEQPADRRDRHVQLAGRRGLGVVGPQLVAQDLAVDALADAHGEDAEHGPRPGTQRRQVDRHARPGSPRTARGSGAPAASGPRAADGRGRRHRLGDRPRDGDAMLPVRAWRSAGRPARVVAGRPACRRRRRADAAASGPRRRPRSPSATRGRAPTSRRRQPVGHLRPTPRGCAGRPRGSGSARRRRGAAASAPMPRPATPNAAAIGRADAVADAVAVGDDLRRRPPRRR